jgi:hypothetical protein
VVVGHLFVVNVARREFGLTFRGENYGDESSIRVDVRRSTWARISAATLLERWREEVRG